VIVGLAMTGTAPVRSWVFRGDTVDVETVAQVKPISGAGSSPERVRGRMRGWSPRANLRALARGRRGRHPLHMPVKAGNEVSEEVLRAPAGTTPSRRTSRSGGGRRTGAPPAVRGVLQQRGSQAAARPPAQILAELEAGLPELTGEAPTASGLRAPGQRAVTAST